MLNPFANALMGGLAGAGSGVAGGEANSTASIYGFVNPTALQAQQFHQQYAKSVEQMAQANIKNVGMPGVEEPKPFVKEAPKVELNPKRAVQLEE